MKTYGTDLVTKFLHFLLLRNAMPKIFPTILDTLVKLISCITKKYSWFPTYYLCYIQDNLVISLTYWRLMEHIWSPNFYIFCSCETQCLKYFTTILDTVVKFISYITKKYSWFPTYYLCYIQDNLVISLTYWRLMEHIWSPNF